MGDAVPPHTVMQWSEDVLGHDFEATELTLPPDAEGEVCATLVRHRRPSWSPRHWSPLQWSPLQWSRQRPSFDVLYVHGCSDYFFQRELAEFWTERGATFYALDLRKYGRSLRPHQTPGYIDDLETYDEDIAAALAVMRSHSRRPLVLMGHSTGGLTLSLWAARHPGEAVGLVLSSPWLEFQMGPAARALLEPMVELGKRLLPLGQYPQFDHGFYSRSISTRFEGEWDVEARWKPDLGFRANRGWLSAIFRGQAHVGEGLGLPMPVLVMLSQRSLLQAAWTPEMAHADVVIDVDAAAHRAVDLGSDVTIRRFEGALHDVVLSEKPVRDAVWNAIRDWLPRVV
jgi:alpha-beta hydrolase superfamily lysophospholipase